MRTQMKSNKPSVLKIKIVEEKHKKSAVLESKKFFYSRNIFRLLSSSECLSYRVVTTLFVASNFNGEKLDPDHEDCVFRWEFFRWIGSEKGSKGEVIEFVESFDEIPPLQLSIGALQVIFLQRFNLQIWKLFTKCFVDDAERKILLSWLRTNVMIGCLLIVRCKFQKSWVDRAQEVEVKFSVLEGSLRPQLLEQVVIAELVGWSI